MNRIREQRERVGISRADLAAQVGVSERTVERWEAGAVKRGLGEVRLAQVAAALNCSVDDLIVTSVTTETRADVAPAPETPLTRAAARKGLRIYLVLTTSVAEAGLAEGAEIVVDTTQGAISARRPGDILLVRPQAPAVLLLRQWLPPDLLTTNAPGANAAMLGRVVGATVLGVVVRDEAPEIA